MPAQSFFLIAILLQLWQCKSILFAVFLKDVHMTCVLEELELSTGWIPFCGIRTVWGKSFDECILICNLLRPENKCNAIKYYQTLMKCYLLTAPKNSRATETQHESHKVIFIYGCSKGSYYLHEIENFSMLVLGGTFISLKIEILNKTFIIERRPTADSILLPIASLLVMRGFGRLDAMLSSIILEQAYVNSVVIKATHNMSYELISESRSPVGESGPNSKQAEQTSMEAYVHLYRYMEVCKISVIHSGKIENVTSIQIISNVRSINRCLHFCRPWLHQIFYCAVIYTKHNYKCELLKRNTERSITRFVDDESNLIELLNCYPDRQHERRNNPSPVRYYLKQTGEICVLEFYNATQLSGFHLIETLENVENIKSCIYACRLRYSSYICLAIIYTMKKQCTLLGQESNHEIYNIESESLFAEILFCEPGTLCKNDGHWQGILKADYTSYDNSEKNTKIDLLYLVHKFQSRNPVLFSIPKEKVYELSYIIFLEAENDMKTMKQIRIKQIALATAHFKQATEDLSFSSEKEPES
ncbi:hypothetical protein T4B_2564 [Trichinella pseudospiralis]|uniref:Apple domain-containing protein n=2 Tax=Trichinella pseudospiralis TaxID=6337 RepID=A0A0V1IYZ4_TRIPS|nr:hypothetical protein T4B_2564 [Trichinella pseudospiralis]